MCQMAQASARICQCGACWTYERLQPLVHMVHAVDLSRYSFLKCIGNENGDYYSEDALVESPRSVARSGATAFDVVNAYDARLDSA